MARIVTQEEFLGGGGVTAVQPPQQRTVSFEEFSGGGEVKLYEPKSEPEKLGFLKRFGEDLKDRAKVLEEINTAYAFGEQSFADSVLQVGGKVAFGGMLDLLGEGVVSAVRGVKKITPDILAKGFV